MSRLWFVVIIVLLMILFVSFPIPNRVNAQAAENCTRIGVAYTTDPSPIPEGLPNIRIIFFGISDGRYQLRFRDGLRDVWTSYGDAYGGRLTLDINNSDNKLTIGNKLSTLERWNAAADRWSDFCGFIWYKVGYDFNDCHISFRPRDPRDNERFAIDVQNTPQRDYAIYMGVISETGSNTKLGIVTTDAYGKGTIEVNPISPPRRTKVGLSMADPDVNPTNADYFCKTDLTILSSGGATPRPIPEPGSDPIAGPSTAAGGIPCDPGNIENPGIKTAIGCIHTSPKGFVKDFLTFAVGISGGLAFLMMLLGAFQMLTSAGNPETLQAGRERFTNAIIGLMIIIFAVLLLQIIGFGILKIPGFGA